MQTFHGCCPNRLRPRHQAEVLDTKESGGHTSAYTEDDYRIMCELRRFQGECVVRTGTAAVYQVDRGLRAIPNEFVAWGALPVLPIALPIVGLATFNPRIPFSLYTKAIKTGRAL
jgi:hypothetical protein